MKHKMQIIKEESLTEAQRKIQSLASKDRKRKDIIVLGQDDEFNRKMLENKHVAMLVLNEDMKQGDYMKQRASGLNEVLCSIARKNDIKIGVEAGKIIRKKGAEQARSLSRLAQNITLCKKAEAELVFIGKPEEKKALQSLMLALGASTSQAKTAVEAKFF